MAVRQKKPTDTWFKKWNIQITQDTWSTVHGAETGAVWDIPQLSPPAGINNQ